MYVTVADRAARDVERVRSASAVAIDELRSYASADAGRYLVFGSVARGDLVPESDFDVVADFAAQERAAAIHAEALCRRLGLIPDVHLASQTSDRLMTRVRRDAIVLA